MDISVMKIIKIFVLLSVARNVSPRRHKSSSGESIENLLFYQDCKHKSTTEPTTTINPTKLRGLGDEASCPYPKMCCSMSCNNEPCVSEQLNHYGRNLQPNNIEPVSNMPGSPFQQQFAQNQAMQRARKKKMRPPPGIKPLSGRRDFGFTKDRIKSLISNDEDIRKILKDLVRVAMQKVDLQQMINSRRSELIAMNPFDANTVKVTTNKPDSEDEYEEYD